MHKSGVLRPLDDESFYIRNVKVKVKQSHYRPGQTPRIPGG
jgi:hypothetical protein